MVSSHRLFSPVSQLGPYQACCSNVEVSRAYFSPWFPCYVRRYLELLEQGDKDGAYGYVAQLFDGMDVSEILRLSEESFSINMDHLVSY